MPGIITRTKYYARTENKRAWKKTTTRTTLISESEKYFCFDFAHRASSDIGERMPSGNSGGKEMNERDCIKTINFGTSV